MEIVLIERAANKNKQELQELGREDAREAMASGDYSPLELVITARKASEYLSAFVKDLDPNAREELLQHYKNEASVLGSKASLGSTGDRPNLEEDPIYKELAEKLKARADLLKLARRSTDPIFDSEGIEVPKVGLKSASREVLKIAL